jgi:hypothetical protein
MAKAIRNMSMEDYAKYRQKLLHLFSPVRSEGVSKGTVVYDADREHFQVWDGNGWVELDLPLDKVLDRMYKPWSEISKGPRQMLLPGIMREDLQRAS